MNKLINYNFSKLKITNIIMIAIRILIQTNLALNPHKIKYSNIVTFKINRPICIFKFHIKRVTTRSHKS